MHVRKSIIGVAAALVAIPAGTALAATIQGGPGPERLVGTRVADEQSDVVPALRVAKWRQLVEDGHHVREVHGSTFIA